MKIQLISLTIDNFKCYEHREFRFDGKSAAIFGRNGTGKTTVYDAFTWLLFGKDSRGSANSEALKPTFQEGEHTGEVKDHGAVTAVEAVLHVDGAKRSLKRTYFEVWSVKRGSTEKTQDGHSSDYFVDGVPVKKGEFERRVGELVPEDRFKLLTSLFFFSRQLPWRDRRAVLFDVAGVATDGEIMASDDRFAPLAEGMGTLSLDDYRKTLMARRKGLNKTRNDTPARLDECRKTVENLSGIDFAALEAEREAKVNVRNGLREELEAVGRDPEGEKLDLEITEAREALRKLEADNGAFRAGQKRSDSAVEQAGLRQAIAGLQAAERRRKGDLAYLRERVEDLDREIGQCRKQWDRIDAEQFHGELCPTCGQRLPQDKLEAAVAGFERDKSERKARTVEAAKKAKERRQKALEDAERLERDEDGLKLKTLEARLDELVNAPEPEITDLPGYRHKWEELENQILELQRLRANRVEAAAVRRKALHEDLDRVQKELDFITGELAKRAHIDLANQRMDELRAQAQAAAGELAQVDRLLALCDSFTRYKVQFIEESINRRFELVRFRLFRPQLNGGIEDCCDVLVGGAAVGGTLNTGAEFQAGVDIINTLSRCYDLHVPLFIDGSESVTEPLRADTQVIRLVVSENDKELRCQLQ